MRYRGKLLVLALSILPQVAAGQMELRVTGQITQVILPVDVLVYAQDMSHVEDVSIVPAPTSEPIWRGKTRASRCLIPLDVLERGALIMVRARGRLGFMKIEEKDRSQTEVQPLALKNYRRLRIFTRHDDGNPADKIPVFMAATVDLMMKHLS